MVPCNGAEPCPFLFGRGRSHGRVPHSLKRLAAGGCILSRPMRAEVMSVFFLKLGLGGGVRYAVSCPHKSEPESEGYMSLRLLGAP